MLDKSKILMQFLIESKDSLDLFERSLLDLESSSIEPGFAYGEMFRALHSIKGSAGIFGFSQISKISHEAESLLELLQSGQLKSSKEIYSDLLNNVDSIKAHLESIKNIGSEDLNLINETEVLEAKLSKYRSTVADQRASEKVIQPKRKLSASQIKALQALGEAGEEYLENPSLLNNNSSHHSGTKLQDDNVKISSMIFKDLEDISGELVFLRNRIVKEAKLNSKFSENILDLDRAVNELKDLVSDIGMARFATITTQLQRAVRDLAIKLNKRVNFVIEGEQVRIDKSVLARLYDPIIHMIRNAVDHGIEVEEERISKAKNPEAKISLRLKQLGDFVIINIIDDGRGIDLELIKAKAIKKALLDPLKAERLSDKELIDFIFAPGFSTKENLSEISGRGIGMDVVKTNILKINGSIQVDTKLGQGTNIEIKVPSSVAFTKILMVDVLGMQFAIPESSILEFASADVSQLKYSQGRCFIEFRKSQIELVFAKDFIQRIDDKYLSETCELERSFNYLVITVDAYIYALVVDAIHDIEDVAIKTIETDLPFYSGTTILDDGKAALVLEMSSIARRFDIQRNVELNEKISEQIANYSKVAKAETVVELVKAPSKLALSFLIDEQLYAIPVDNVEELIPFESSNSKYPLTKVPGSNFRGLVNVRGKVINSYLIKELVSDQEMNLSAVIKLGDKRFSTPLPEVSEIINLEKYRPPKEMPELTEVQQRIVKEVLELSTRQNLFVLNCEECFKD